MRFHRVHAGALAVGLASLWLGAGGRTSFAASPDLPESLKPVTRTRKARLASAWGGYQLRAGGPVLTLSADGRRAASGGPGGALRLWDLDTGRQTRVLGSGQEAVSSAAFAPDGKRLAAGGPDGSIALWDIDTGKQTRSFGRHQGEVTAFAFTADGERLASGGEDGTVRVWNLGHGRNLFLPGHGDVVRALAFFADGTRLASAGDDGTVRVWELARGRAQAVFGAANGPEALAVAVSPDGTRLLVGREGAGIGLIDIRSGTERVLGSAPRVLAVAFSADGRRALAAVASKRDVRPATAKDTMPPTLEIQTWDTSTGEALAPLGDLDEGFVAAALSRDGRRALLTSAGGLTLWDLETRAVLRSTRGHTSRIEAIAVADDGRLALSAADDGTARLWQTLSGKELFTFSGYAKSVRAIALSKSADRALVGDAAGLIRVWDLGRLVPTTSVGPHRGVLGVAFAEGGGNVVSASLERTAIWDAVSGKEVFSSWFPRLATAVALSPDGRVVLTTDLVDGPQVRECATGRILKALKRPHRSARTVALSGNGALAAVVTGPLEAAGADSLELWDVAKGALLRSAKVSRGMRVLAFSEGGRLLLTAGADGSMRLYTGNTLREVDRFDLQANAEAPTAASFEPDGLSFLVGTSVGALQHYLIIADPYR